MAEIKFCENNFEQGVEDVISRLEEDGAEVVVEGCLDYCGECAKKPFALVNDEYVDAETAEELYDKISGMI